MIAYSAYGLSLESNLSLPELSAFKGNPGVADVEIFEKPLATENRQDHRLQYLPCGPEQVLIHWPGLGLLEAVNGTLLGYAPPAEGPHRLMWRLFLVCQGLGVILQQRGFLVLHASAVVHAGRAAVFLGTHGMGKSTLAAAACTAGWELLSDDVTALEVSNTDKPIVRPAFGRLRIHPGTRKQLGFDGLVEGELIEGAHKLLCNVEARFRNLPLPLGRIYVLTDQPTLELITPPALEQLFHLSSHTYGKSLTKYIGKAGLHLQQCSALIRQGMVKVLRRPRDLGAIGSVLAAVAHDLAS